MSSASPNAVNLTLLLNADVTETKTERNGHLARWSLHWSPSKVTHYRSTLGLSGKLGRKRLWQDLRVPGIQDHQYRTTDTTIRNGHQNNLSDRIIGGNVYVKVRLWDGRRELALKKDLIAISVYGLPPRWHCDVCGTPVPYIAKQLNGKITDTTPDNLKWVPNVPAQLYHGLCLEHLIQEIPIQQERDPILRLRRQSSFFSEKDVGYEDLVALGYGGNNDYQD